MARSKQKYLTVALPEGADPVAAALAGHARAEASAAAGENNGYELQTQFVLPSDAAALSERAAAGWRIAWVILGEKMVRHPADGTASRQTGYTIFWQRG